MRRMRLRFAAFAIFVLHITTITAVADRIDLIVNFAEGGKLSGNGQVFSITPSCGPAADCAFDPVVLDLHKNDFSQLDGLRFVAELSLDGSVAVGLGRQSSPSVWSATSGVRTLAKPREPNSYTSFAHSVNSDGTVAVGKLNDRPSVWVSGSSIELPASIRKIGEVVGVSADGATFGGDVITSGGSRVFVMHETDVHFLDTPEDFLWSHAQGLSADGANLLGYHHGVDNLGHGIRHGFVWNAEKGMTDLGILIPVAASFDGGIVIGNGAEPMVWDPDNGARVLQDVFAAEIDRLTVPDLRLSEAIDISHDGKTIVGTGFTAFDAEVAWILRIGDFEACDLNADGVCDAVDIDGIRTETSGSWRPNTAYDLNSDHLIDHVDRSLWLEIMNTVHGDANLDGQVQMDDFLALAAHYGQGGGWAAGDFDGNGVVLFPDFLLLAGQFGRNTGTIQAVPEPHFFPAFVLAAAVILRRPSRPERRPVRHDSVAR